MASTARRRRFVDEYLVDLNAAAAAIRAGYGGKNARQVGHETLQDEAVQDAIAEAMAAREKRTHISQDRVLRELGRIAFSDIADAVTWGAGGIQLLDSDSIPAEVRAAISEVSETQTGRQRTIKVKLLDKLGALRLLAAHTGIGAQEAATDEGEDIGDDPDPPVAPEA